MKRLVREHNRNKAPETYNAAPVDERGAHREQKEGQARFVFKAVACFLGFIFLYNLFVDLGVMFLNRLF